MRFGGALTRAAGITDIKKNRWPSFGPRRSRASRTKRALQMTTTPLRILVVDDNVDAAGNDPADAGAFFRRQTGLRWSRGHRSRKGNLEPDAVLLDLRLPGMSGLEIATVLKGIPELYGCVLVAVSGYDAESIKFPSLFEHHFQKPLDHQALLKLLGGIRASRLESGFHRQTSRRISCSDAAND